MDKVGGTDRPSGRQGTARRSLPAARKKGDMSGDISQLLKLFNDLSQPSLPFNETRLRPSGWQATQSVSQCPAVMARHFCVDHFAMPATVQHFFSFYLSFETSFVSSVRFRDPPALPATPDYRFLRCPDSGLSHSWSHFLSLHFPSDSETETDGLSR